MLSSRGSEDKLPLVLGVARRGWKSAARQTRELIGPFLILPPSLLHANWEPGLI